MHLEKELKKHPDALFLDIGANLGMYSIIAAKMGHKVIAFEPLQRNVEKICASVADNELGDNVRVYYSALSNKPNEYVIFRRHARNIGGTSTVGRNISDVTGAFGVDYSTTITLDDLEKEFRGKKLIVKMDIEGSECRAIAGGLHALKSASSIEVLLTEWFQVGTRCEDGEEYVKNLESLGLKPYTVDGHEKLGEWRYWRDIDLMFRSSPP